MNDKLHVSTRKGLFTAKRGARGWTIEKVDFLGDNVTLTLNDKRDGTLYAALDHGHFGVKVQRSKGSGWEEIPAPAYPPKPEDEVDVDPWGRTVNWSTTRIWAMEAGGADEPGVLWCGTLPGGVFRSEDRGQSWSLVRSLWDHPLRKKWSGGGADWPGVHSICVDPRNSKQVSVAVSTGGVWFTPDSGATWELRGQGMRGEYMPQELAGDPISQDVHCLVQCPSDPRRMWVQHHNGIFVSSDEGRTFTEITDVKPSVFGFPVVVHPSEPDTAWFVPAVKDEKRYPVEGKLVVTRTRDGGKSFYILREGLPQEHAYDLVWRHALAIDDSGERLAFGSTTGGLWVSENQGDSWSLVSHTLPPVHGVRFG